MTTIPPVYTLGPIEARLPDIVARVAANLHADEADEWLASAVEAAAVWVIDVTNRSTIGLPDDAPTVNGLVGFATRIFGDPFSAGGAQVAIGDPTFEPIFNPERLDKHWRDYWRRLYRAWGIA